MDLDRTVGYVGPPDEEERFAHPHGGDVCTSVQLSEVLWGQLVGCPADTLVNLPRRCPH